MKEQIAVQAKEFIEWLAEYGGTEDGGVTRLLYSKDWKLAQQALALKMQACGLQVYEDRVGNLFGRLEGTIPGAKTILTGSHVDTVINGGKYDGAFGVIAGIIALQYLFKTFGRPRRSLEVVALCEEEGSRFPLTYWGSGSITGHHDFQIIAGMKDADGVGFEEAMREAGFGAIAQRDCVRNDIASFIELHIEQGVVLERQGIKLGIVDSIVGQKRFTFKVEGEAGHAGTTPMKMRRDALTGAAEMVLQLEKSVPRHGEQLVATVGFIEAIPNVTNVIPGKLSFTVDVRHPDEHLLTQFCIGMIGRFHEIAATRGLHLEVNQWMNEAPVHLDQALSDQVEAICRVQEISCQRMISGAGHDSQIFQPFCPTALLFVPSQLGISHSPLEFTAPEDLTNGIIVLIQMLYHLGYEENFDEKL